MFGDKFFKILIGVKTVIKQIIWCFFRFNCTSEHLLGFPLLRIQSQWFCRCFPIILPWQQSWSTKVFIEKRKLSESISLEGFEKRWDTALASITANSVLLSYRNQSIDLLCKSVDWFLYEGNTGNWLKQKIRTLELRTQLFRREQNRYQNRDRVVFIFVVNFQQLSWSMVTTFL